MAAGRIYNFAFFLLTFQGTSTFVESPLQIHPFSAKQTQFAKCSNERNLFLYSGL